MIQFPEAVMYRRAPSSQAGVLSGAYPTRYDVNDPFKLWVIQVVLIVIISRLCYMLFWRIRQPRVVAEIIGGIILGPTAMGRIPHFTATIFPQDSIPLLNLCATLGLVLFLFLAGLEIEVRLIRKHARTSALVSIAGLVSPFAFGSLLAVPLYREFSNDSMQFGYFLLFTCISVGITAFPILCRMLAELGLFDTTLGVVVLSAGVGNDIVGWVLLALAVTLVNSTSSLAALWIVLACVGYTLFLLYPIRWLFRWIALKTGELETGDPSSIMVTCAIIMLLVSAFFTDIIGLHAIFGGFLSGLVIPRDKNLSIALMRRLEGIVWNVFLPIYFALSGLKTDLGLLNTGKAWGFTVLVCTMAYMGKFIGCASVSKLLGFTWRESSAIGTLMSCKGLLELIVINIALQANVFTSLVFAMFVLHAVVLTVIVTPLTGWIYPDRYRTMLGATSDTATERTASDLECDPLSPEFVLPSIFATCDLRDLPVLGFLAHALGKSPLFVQGGSRDHGLPVPGIHALYLKPADIHSGSPSAEINKDESCGTIFDLSARAIAQASQSFIAPSHPIAPSPDLAMVLSRHIQHPTTRTVVLPITVTSTGNALDKPCWRSSWQKELCISALNQTLWNTVFFLYGPTCFPENRTSADERSRGYHLVHISWGGSHARLASVMMQQLCCDDVTTSTVRSCELAYDSARTPVDSASLHEKDATHANTSIDTKASSVQAQTSSQDDSFLKSVAEKARLSSLHFLDGDRLQDVLGKEQTKADLLQKRLVFVCEYDERPTRFYGFGSSQPFQVPSAFDSSICSPLPMFLLDAFPEVPILVVRDATQSS
ncbi:hypothetical protein OE88DRAFT_1660775 [Heliocybe sulcata]|uniref:Cation/H+ exchanger transmembrane domain-containing protein n=1 Tax=Heliocybe sulcata TaxID=5364 RepID=A0A5C3N2S9_9AGAM|nr:hypothetical protein OE88DRAFT_1660775 [Heliocybe sulcata]